MPIQSPTATGTYGINYRAPAVASSGLSISDRGAIWGGGKGATYYAPGASVLPVFNVPGAANTGGGGTGVVTAPWGLNFSMPGGIGGQGGQQQSGIDWNAILSASQKPYASLTEKLKAITDAERQRISQATNMATTMLGEVDPMAAYRESYQALAAPEASASSYLSAIGANPAQVQAQQNLANQLMAQQAAGQQGFGSAVDTANQNYRLAQLAEAYANQQRAQYGLEATSGAQQAAIDMAATQQRNQVAQMMLEAQLRLLEIQAQQNKGRAGSVVPAIGAASLGF